MISSWKNLVLTYTRQAILLHGVGERTEGYALFDETVDLQRLRRLRQRQSASPFLSYRKDETLTASFSWNFNRIDLPSAEDAFNMNLVQARLEYSFTPKMSLQRSCSTTTPATFCGQHPLLLAAVGELGVVSRVQRGG